MNREIKFRGKRVDNNEFVYGCLINNLFYKSESKKPCCYIIPDIVPDNYYYDCFEDVAGWIEDFEVVPESLGQYTGLKDSKLNDIYEGDIIKSWYSRDMSGKDIINTLEVVEYDTSSIGSAGFEVNFLNNAVVIGNIFENPELLTK